MINDNLSSGNVGLFGKNGYPNFKLIYRSRFCERRGRRSLRFYTNVSITVVGTRRAVSGVKMKLNQLSHCYNNKPTFP